MKKLQIAPKHIKAIFTNKSINNIQKELLFRQALIDFPEYEVGILYLLLLTLDFLNKTEECIEVCDRIIPSLEDKFEFGYIYFFQGKRYLFLNNKEKAIDCFNKAVEINKVREAGVELASIYKDNLDWANVIKAFDSIECIEKEHKLEKYLQKGIAYTKINELDKAIFCYKKYLEIDKKHTGIMDNLSIIYGDLGRLDECIEILVKKMKINPNDAEIYFNIGVTYFEKGDYHTSLQYYKEALKLRPDYPSAYINMGSMAFEDMGEIEKGLEYLKKAQELNIEDNLILKALFESFVDVYTLLEDFDQVAFYRLKLTTLEEIVDDDNEEEYENV